MKKAIAFFALALCTQGPIRPICEGVGCWRLCVLAPPGRARAACWRYYYGDAPVETADLDECILTAEFPDPGDKWACGGAIVDGRLQRTVLLPLRSSQSDRRCFPDPHP